KNKVTLPPAESTAAAPGRRWREQRRSRNDPPDDLSQARPVEKSRSHSRPSLRDGMVGAVSAQGRGNRQLERGDGDRADRHIAAAAALAQCRERRDRALRLGRVRDRVLPDLRLRSGARAARARVARSQAGCRSGQGVSFSAPGQEIGMLFAKPFGVRFHLRLAMSTLAAALCVGAAAGSATAAEKLTYLLPAPPSLPAFAPWVLAKHLGYYAEAGYDVDFVVARGGVDVAKQIGVGNAPIGGAIGDTPIIVRGNGVPVKSVGLMGGGALTVVVGRKDRGIEKLEDLRGKKISVLAFQDTTYYALLGALASKIIGKGDVDAQAVGPASVASLVVAGAVDACACTPDWEINVKDTVSLPTKDYFQSMSQAILASDKIIAERPDMVRAIVKATLKGMQYVMEDPNKAALAYVEASPSFKGKEELMKKILANYVERTYKGQSLLGAMDPQRLANVQHFYKEQGFIETELPVGELYSNDFIQELAALSDGRATGKRGRRRREGGELMST